MRQESGICVIVYVYVYVCGRGLMFWLRQGSTILARNLVHRFDILTP